MTRGGLGARTYSAGADRTLTLSQSRRKQFRGRRGFRAPSNATLRGYKTGYHEAALTTDLYIALRRATILPNGRLGLARRGWGPHGQVTFDRQHADMIASIGDALRTDTARTILSAPHDLAAGHSGANVVTTNQKAAHDVLRQAVGHLLGQQGTSPLFRNRKALTVAMGAVMIASYAPGDVASTATGSASLKDVGAKSSWEANREEAKLRLDTLEATLSGEERRAVRASARRFMTSISSRRELAPNRSRSPLRDTARQGQRSISGGGYDARRRGGTPNEAPPSDPAEWGLYLSSPFRQLRR